MSCGSGARHPTLTVAFSEGSLILYALTGNMECEHAGHEESTTVTTVRTSAPKFQTQSLRFVEPHDEVDWRPRVTNLDSFSVSILSHNRRFSNGFESFGI